MKKLFVLSLLCLFAIPLFAGTVEKTYTFSNYTTKFSGSYSMITFDHTLLTGKPGEPMLPYQAVSLLLPPGEVAQSIEIIREDQISIPGTFMLYPQQYYHPVSAGISADFIKAEKVYQSTSNYPVDPAGKLMTQYLNGYAFALSTFTPLQYNPSTGNVSYFQHVKVRISTKPGEKSLSAGKNLTSSANAHQRVREFAQNPELMDLYPIPFLKQSGYKIMIITPDLYSSGFADLVHYYDSLGMEARVFTTESIYSQGTGVDNQEMIRNAIMQEYQANGVEYVLLGGGTSLIPYRGFYCYVESGSGYTDTDIPADLYYSGMDGNYDANGNHIYGEVDDDPDLLPDVSVGRFPFSTAQELAAMVHKSVAYQAHPVLGELKDPFLVGEFLTDSPTTYGGDYLDLLVNEHSDNGYFTHGIPDSENTIEKMYDTPTYNWTTAELITKINEGKSFIHHLGHANTDYMMRLTTDQITNANFPKVNGIDHNYTILYTQGCYCGAFDQPGCIAVASVTIENFLVAGVFNSRYGWFDQGLTEGPSEHLQREFVSAIYTDTLPEKHLGTAQVISKIKTAPWVTAPGEFEPGAQRWCHYDCNVLGDPALTVWTEEPSVGIQKKNQGVSFSVYPNPAKDKVFVQCNLSLSTDVHLKIINLYGQNVTQTSDFLSQTKGDHTFSLQLPKLAPGIYFLKVETSVSSESRKITITE